MKRILTILALLYTTGVISQSINGQKQNLFVKLGPRGDDISVNNAPFYQFNSSNLMKQTKTKGLQIKEYTYKFGEPILSNKLSASIKFDSLGNIIEDLIYRENGAIALKTTNKFDKKSRLVENTLWMEGFSVPQKEVNIYTDANNSKEVFRYSDGKLAFHCIYKYDGKGNEIEYTLFDNSGNTSINNIDTRFKKKYNDFGKMIECTRYYEGKIGGVQGTYKDFYVYDDKNNLIQGGTNGVVDLVYTYEYDPTFIRRTRQSDGNNEVNQISFALPFDPFPIMSIINIFNGEYQSYEANSYDVNSGLITQKDFYNNNQKVYKTAKYSYDTVGRIIEEIEYNDVQEPVKRSVVTYN